MEKPLVLLVDDNEATCTLITAVLQREFVVETANDGFEAIEKLKRRRYAAVLLDLLMPHADGYVVLDFLSAERSDVLPNVIVVTAALSSMQTERLRAYDICAIVSKPFEIDRLLATVKRCAGAEDDDAPPLRGPLLSSGMILLLAEVLKRV